MAAQNQDFVTYAGDAVSPIFTVVAADGVTPINISSASAITWQCQRNLKDPIVQQKTLASAQIVLLNGGLTGQFQVKLLSADTSGLSGWYMHSANITDSSGNVTTCTVGRMNVGIAPNWTWDPGSVGVEPLYTVRQMIGDTFQADQLQSDQQILWALAQYSNEYLAAAECCRNISAAYARQVDIVTGLLKTNYSQRSKRYGQMALDLEQRGMARGGVTAIMDSISITAKQTNEMDTDRVQPQFVLGEFENLLPEGAVGHETGAVTGGEGSDDLGELDQ